MASTLKKLRHAFEDPKKNARYLAHIVIIGTIGLTALFTSEVVIPSYVNNDATASQESTVPEFPDCVKERRAGSSKKCLGM